MPGGDRRGPEGRGPMTGRGLGYCAGYDRPGYQADAPPYGRGYGWGGGRGYGWGGGRGYGRGFRRGFGGPRLAIEPGTEPVAAPLANSSLADEVARLKEQLQALEQRLAEANSAD